MSNKEFAALYGQIKQAARWYWDYGDVDQNLKASRTLEEISKSPLLTAKQSERVKKLGNGLLVHLVRVATEE